MRIAQARAVELELAAIGIHAEDGAGARIVHQHAVRRAHVVTAIADRPVDLAVVPKHESVHIVAAQRNTHAVTRRILRDDFRNAVAIAIKQSPEMRNVRVEDFAI